jgi:5'-nucleotidase
VSDSRNLAPGIAAFVAAVLVALIGLGASADSPSESPATTQGTVNLRLLGVNDFHGHLEPPRSGIGGAAWLDAHLDRATIPGRTIRVHAGDMVGASPLVSSWFHDEPSIEAANQMEFDVGTVGNHEFDEGGDELLRLLRGGQRTGPEALKRDADGSLVNTSSPDYTGAAFPYVSANTFYRDGELVLPPFQVVERAGVRVGFIGVTTESTPHFLLPRHSERFRFTDISDAVNRWVPELQRRGVEAIVVLAHSGAHTAPGDTTSAAGEIVGEAGQMSDAVDVVIAGHSHSLLNLRIPNMSGGGDKLVVEALSYGVAYDRVDMTVDRATGEVVEKSAEVPSTAHAGVEQDPEVAAHVARRVDRVAPLADRVVGTAETSLTRADGRLGQLAADAQLALAQADVAVVNAGSVRADLDAGPLAYEELFAVHPYDFDLLRVELSGRNLTELLAGSGSSQLYVAGRGGPYDPGATYTVVANELIATGDFLPALRDGARHPRAVGTEVEALTSYVEHDR